MPPVSLTLVALAIAGALRRGAPAQADASAKVANVAMTCEPAGAPGRVRCDVVAHAAAGEAIAWGDVVIVRTPDFVSALRGRIGAHDAATHEPEVWRWPLALVARDRGAGDLEARVRLVVCKEGACSPRTVTVVARVVVGG